MMRYLACFSMLIGVCVCIGCGGEVKLEGLVPVSGTVTLAGQPVEGASVAFKSEGAGRAAAGTTDASGRFQLTTLKANDGAAPGKYKVTVIQHEKRDIDVNAPDPMTVARMSGKPLDPTDAAAAAEMMKSPKNLLPEKYANADESGLTAEVTSGGDNDFTFDLVK